MKSNAKVKSATTTKSGKPRKARRWSAVATKRGYTLPVKLQCKVTGKTIEYTNPEYIDKKIVEYGSLKNLRRNFISREGRAQLNQHIIGLHSHATGAKLGGRALQRAVGGHRKAA